MSRVRNLEAPWRKTLAVVMVRVRGDLSIRKQAKILGLPYGTLQRIETGLGADVDTLVKISAVTGKGFDELLVYGACDHQWVEEPGTSFTHCSLCPMVGLFEK